MPKIVRLFEQVLRAWDSWEGRHKPTQLAEKAQRWGLGQSEVAEFTRLRDRAATLLACSAMALTVGLVLGAVVLISSGAASLAGPAETLGKIHVPGELYTTLSNMAHASAGRASSGAGIGTLAELQSPFAVAIDLMNSTFFRVIAGIALIMGLVPAVLTQRFMPLSAGVMLMMMPILLTEMLTTVDPSSQSSSTQVESSSLKESDRRGLGSNGTKNQRKL